MLTHTQIAFIAALSMAFGLAIIYIRSRRATTRLAYMQYIMSHHKVGDEILMYNMAAALQIEVHKVRRFVRRQAALHSYFTPCSGGKYVLNQRGADAYREAIGHSFGHRGAVVTA